MLSLSLLERQLAIFFFFFNVTAPPAIYTLSLHDALPIFLARRPVALSDGHPHGLPRVRGQQRSDVLQRAVPDRKSTRLNSSHRCISYAVFCLKKKNTSKAT